MICAYMSNMLLVKTEKKQIKCYETTEEKTHIEMQKYSVFKKLKELLYVYN